MSGRATAATCRHASRIGAAVLDGVDLGAADRLHLATCAICSREAERASRFLAHLGVAAETAMDGVPASSAVAGGRPIRFVPRLAASAAMFAGAAAAGLLLAAVVGLRLVPPAEGPPALATMATAEAGLTAMDLACVPTAGGARCESGAPDHVHRVLLTEAGGLVVRVEAGIIGRDGRAIDLRGADDLLRRMTTATLEGQREALATAWLASAYAECVDTCSADVSGMRLSLEKRADAVILTVEARRP